MNPKSEEFKEELTRRQYEHALPYFDQDAQRIKKAYDTQSEVTQIASLSQPDTSYVEPIAPIPHGHKKPDWEVIEPLHYINKEVSPDEVQYLSDRVPLYGHKQHHQTHLKPSTVDF